VVLLKGLEEESPPPLTLQVHVVDVDAPTRAQHSHRLAYIRETLPFVETHEDDRALDQIDRFVGDRSEIPAVELDKFDIVEPLAPLARVKQHLR
jgi:hypothetical protein